VCASGDPHLSAGVLVSALFSINGVGEVGAINGRPAGAIDPVARRMFAIGAAFAFEDLHALGPVCPRHVVERGEGVIRPGGFEDQRVVEVDAVQCNGLSFFAGC
jgi:hypothetical protein